MARVLRGLALLLALALGLGAGAPAGAGDEAWLLGRWEQVRDPDGSPKDSFVFAADGKATSIAADGRRFGGRYAVTGREVQIDYKVGNESILITLTYGPDKQRLYARSARTGNTAVYEKRP